MPTEDDAPPSFSAAAFSASASRACAISVQGCHGVIPRLSTEPGREEGGKPASTEEGHGVGTVLYTVTLATGQPLSFALKFLRRQSIQQSTLSKRKDSLQTLRLMTARDDSKLLTNTPYPFSTKVPLLLHFCHSLLPASYLSPPRSRLLRMTMIAPTFIFRQGVQMPSFPTG